MAIVALLVGALLPALMHLLRAAEGGAWVEVCTAAGSQWVRADAAPAEAGPLAPEGVQSADHCPNCVLHTPTAVMPAQQAAVPAPPGRDGPPALYFAAPRTLFAWAAAQPRAPPRVS